MNRQTRAGGVPTPGPAAAPPRFHTIIEPFRIKSVERIRMTTPEERAERIQAVGYNVFRLRAEDVLKPLFTPTTVLVNRLYRTAGLFRGNEG